ncbi:MAG TPA: wax ester/triacylglycerol synthase family O-acyltransferase [Burkholderiales bacterium]|nr:wax ester/triacylglycerol synthase family O-acyltransferase [Burkholderiales bacterium]
MKQLSGADSMFLQFERGNNFMHVASLSIYDPSTAPGGGVRFKDVLRFFASRVAQFPQFRRRLVSLPLSLDRPYWIESPTIDVEFHVRHIALPHPGDWRQLCIQVARLHSRPLDRSKPLWEAYIIEGLHNVHGVPPGSFALYTKLHHAIIDGESGTELMKALHSLSPEPLDLDEEERNAAGIFHADREPTLVELYSRALVHNVARVPTIAKFSLGTARKVASIGAGALTRFRREGEGSFLTGVRMLLSGDLSALLPRMPPRTRFSGDVSAHRVFEAVSFPLSEFRRIKQQVPRATINDQFLCIVGGALRAYLTEKNELPETSMVAMVPMTLRSAEDKGGDRGNQVGFTVMPVHTEVDDAIDRLRAVVDSAATSKRVTDALGKEIARDLLETLPSVIADPLLRNVQVPRIGLVVSNVRGPDVPLYMAGAQLVNYVPISIAIDGMGLNVTGFSYAGNMWICAVSCRDMLPDPAFFADCLRVSFDQLKEAALREAAYTVAEAEAATAEEGLIEGRVVHPVRIKRKPKPVNGHAHRASSPAAAGERPKKGGKRKGKTQRARRVAEPAEDVSNANA